MLTWIQLWRMLPAGVGEMEVGEMGTEPLMAVAEIVRAAATMMGVAGDNYNPKSLKVLCVFLLAVLGACIYLAFSPSNDISCGPPYSFKNPCGEL